MAVVGERQIASVETDDLAIGEIFERSSHRVRTESGLDYKKRLVAVGDESNKRDRDNLNLVIDMWEQFLKLHDAEYPIPSKKNGNKINPAFEWFYNLEPGEQGTMLEWLSLVPSAKALYPMQRLDDMERVFESGIISERVRDILTNSDDAVAIRARARIMKHIVVENAGAALDEDYLIVSLGGGAGVPAIEATLEIQEKLGIKAKMHMFDQDRDILDFAEETVERNGISKDRVETHEGDYYEAFSTIPKGSANVVEALGLWEYLHDSRCVRLLEASYDLLKPGGVLIISNMLEGRSQLAFNQRGVAWPGVKPRTEEQLMGIVATAQLPTDDIRFTVSDDGVYGVLEIHKPW